MKLLLDLGNSSLKWGLADGQQLVQQGQLAHQGGLARQQLAFLGGLRVAPTEIRVANVAGSGPGLTLAAALGSHFSAPVVWARSPPAGAGVRNGYGDPGQLGIDRWLALCAAHARAPGQAVCVVDAGTATTLDVVLADGAHQGGLILPGLALMEGALRRETGDLDRLARQPGMGATAATGQQPPPFLGRDTAQAIRLGALRATAGLVGAALAQLQREAGAPVRLVLTGGDAQRLLPYLGQPAEYRPTLVLDGLALDPRCFAVADPPGAAAHA